MAARACKAVRSIFNQKSINRFSRKYLSTTGRLSVAGVNDDLFGLTGDQKEFRQTVYDFCQKELAPFADQIDIRRQWLGQFTIQYCQYIKSIT